MELDWKKPIKLIRKHRWILPLVGIIYFISFVIIGTTNCCISIVELMRPLLIIPILCSNFIFYLGKFSLYEYFNSFNVSFPYHFLLAMALTAFVFYFIPMFLISKNSRNRKIVLIFLFIIYLSSLVVEFIITSNILNIFGTEKVYIGTGNLSILLRILGYSIIVLILLNQINKKYNLKYDFELSFKFLFFIFEIILALFIGRLFLLGLIPGTSKVEMIFTNIIIIIIALTLFIIIEFIKNLSPEKLKKTR